MITDRRIFGELLTSSLNLIEKKPHAFSVEECLYVELSSDGCGFTITTKNKGEGGV